jgi:hypothetical protein
MPRESAAVKAIRLLSSGRVVVRHVSDVAIVANVRGDSARIYSVSWSPEGWHCPCDAASTRCSHVQAVQLCTLEPLLAGAPDASGKLP